VCTSTYQVHSLPGVNIWTLGPYFDKPQPRLTAIIILSRHQNWLSAEALARFWSIRTSSHPENSLALTLQTMLEAGRKSTSRSPPYLKNHGFQRSEASATYRCVTTTIVTCPREGMKQKATMSITQWESLSLWALEEYGLPTSQWWLMGPILSPLVKN